MAVVRTDAASDPVGHLAFAHAHPRWIAQAFADALRGSTEELAKLLAADDARPTVHLLARPGEITAEELALTTGANPMSDFKQANGYRLARMQRALYTNPRVVGRIARARGFALSASWASPGTGDTFGSGLE